MDTEGIGLSLDELFRDGQGLTYDDVILLPPFVAEPTLTGDVSLDTELAQGFPLRLPIVSSPMDTVTEWETAIHMALHGGIGVIHFNLSPDEAAGHVRRVKRHRRGFIYHPECRRPDAPITEIDQLEDEKGFSTVLVTEDGTSQTRLLGMVTKRRVVLQEDRSTPLAEVMIPREKLTTYARSEVPSLQEARRILRSVPDDTKLPILNPDGSIHALVTLTDVVKSQRYPHALLDENEQLRVGAAISTQSDDMVRVRALLDAGVDVLVIDSAQGATAFAVRRIREVKELDATVPVIAGNVVTPSQAQPLIESGANGLRVGMGPCPGLA